MITSARLYASRFPARRNLAALGGYLGLIAVWMYVGHDHPAAAIAIPADFDREVPAWFDIALFFVPPAMIVIGVGVAAAKIRKRRAQRV